LYGFSGGSFCTYRHTLHTFSICHFYFFFISPYFSFKTVNDDICCHNFSSLLPRIICVAIMVCGICDYYFSDTKLHGSQKNYHCIKVRESTVSLPFEFLQNHLERVLPSFSSKSSNLWASFMISLQSPCLCSRFRGGKSVSWNPIAGLIHLFPFLRYHLLS